MERAELMLSLAQALLLEQLLRQQYAHRMTRLRRLKHALHYRLKHPAIGLSASCAASRGA